MKRTSKGTRALVWLLFLIPVLAAVIPVIVALSQLSRYSFLRVPLASWFVFVLSGLILILDGMVFRWWRYLQRQGERFVTARAHLVEQDARFPVVCGHTKLTQPEFPVLVQMLFSRFPDIQYIHVTPLPGGYGGSTTVLARLQQAGHAALLLRSFVLKLGDKQEMTDECDKFDRYVDARLVNAPHFHIHRYAEWGDWAGIAYEFAGLGGEIQNFYQFYRGSAVLAAAELIEEIYAPLREAWYQRGEMATVNLYHEYNVLNKKQDVIIGHVGRIVHRDDPYRANLAALEEDLRPQLKPAFCPAPDVPWSDPVVFLRRWPSRSLPVPLHRSVVHGDLHARNVLVEIRKGGFKQVWFIDFSHTGNGLSRARSDQARREGTLVDADSGHTLRDLSRLEADVKFILTRLRHEEDLALAVAFEKELLECGMEMHDLQVRPAWVEALRDERFKKAWQVIREIRRQAVMYLTGPQDLLPYYFSLLHATLPVLYYRPEQFESEACELQQKRYALISAGMLCSRL